MLKVNDGGAGGGRRRYTFGGHVVIVLGSFWNYFGISFIYSFGIVLE